MRLVDMTGLKFGLLTVIGRVESTDKNGQAMWRCDCECGGSTNARGTALRAGHYQSCGCLQGNRTHGLSNCQEYESWRAIRQRCLNSKCKSFKNYGGRGIAICNRWLESFENFLADMGHAPAPRMQIDRIDNNGNYEPSNCRWATVKEQSRNRRNNHFVTVDGQEMVLMDACIKYGIGHPTVLYRMRNGWSCEDAIKTPVRGAIA